MENGLRAWSSWKPNVIKLRSGVKVVVSEIPNRSTVGMAIGVRCGSRYEPNALAGISHLVEHGVFLGTKNYPNGNSLAQAIEGSGGWLEGQTDKEWTLYSGKVPVVGWEEAFRAALELVTAPKLIPEETERERTVVLEELLRISSNPQLAAYLLFDETVWQGAWGRAVGGDPAVVGNISGEEIRNWWKRWYRPERIVVSVAGSIATEEVLSVLEGVFEGEAEPVEMEVEVEHTQKGVRFRVREGRGEQVAVVLGGNVVGYRDERRPAVQLLTTILGDGLGSRLYRRLREEEGLGYDSHASLAQHANRGTLAAVSMVEHRDGAKVVRLLAGEIRKLANKPVTEEELQRAKRYRIGGYLMGLEDTLGVAASLADEELLQGGARNPRDEVEEWSKATASDIQLAAIGIAESLRLVAVGRVEELREELLDEVEV